MAAPSQAPQYTAAPAGHGYSAQYSQPQASQYGAWQQPQLAQPGQQPPQPRQQWAPATLDATQNGPGCRQPHHNADVPCRGQEGPRCQSEDCLNLNIYCPSAQSPSGYPVLFYIYGGAFNEGMNWGPLNIYDGSELAARGGVCVVSTNYRLGVLGFLVTSETPGNQAIMDQRAAMAWTKANILQFGGNPDLMTIWGESAGAMSVAVHMVSPPSRGLFQRAVMQSNVAAFQYQYKLGQQATFGSKFFQLANCTAGDLACVRKLDAKQAIGFGEKAAGSSTEALIDRIIEGGHIEDAFAMQWAPVVDGKELPGQPLALFARGEFTKVPVLIGKRESHDYLCLPYSCLFLG